LSSNVSNLFSPRILHQHSGVSYSGRSVILPGHSKAEEFSTLVYELAHDMLHGAERRTTTTRFVKEIEAEAIAFITTDICSGCRIS